MPSLRWGFFKSNNMTLQDIMKEVESMIDFKLSEQRRTRGHVYARSVYFKLSRELCPLESLSSIGISVNKDHASVLHGINNVFPSLEAYEESFYNIYTEVKSRLLEMYGSGDLYASKVKSSAFLGVHKQYSNELINIKNKYKDIKKKYNSLLKNNEESKSTLTEAVGMIKRVPESKHYDLLVRLDAMTKIMAL
jgi:hypothetical protein